MGNGTLGERRECEFSVCLRIEKLWEIQVPLSYIRIQGLSKDNSSSLSKFHLIFQNYLTNHFSRVVQKLFFYARFTNPYKFYLNPAFSPKKKTLLQY